MTKVGKFLQLEACAHPFFDELREVNARLPNGRPFPPLFNFKHEVCYYLANTSICGLFMLSFFECLILIAT